MYPTIRRASSRREHAAFRRISRVNRTILTAVARRLSNQQRVSVRARPSPRDIRSSPPLRLHLRRGDRGDAVLKTVTRLSRRRRAVIINTVGPAPAQILFYNIVCRICR